MLWLLAYKRDRAVPLTPTPCLFRSILLFFQHFWQFIKDGGTMNPTYVEQLFTDTVEYSGSSNNRAKLKYFVPTTHTYPRLNWCILLCLVLARSAVGLMAFSWLIGYVVTGDTLGSWQCCVESCILWTNTTYVHGAKLAWLVLLLISDHSTNV